MLLVLLQPDFALWDPAFLQEVVYYPIYDLAGGFKTSCGLWHPKRQKRSSSCVYFHVWVFSCYVNGSIYLFCVTVKHPVSWVNPSLRLVRMRCSWVNWTHPIRVTCKTATVRVSECGWWSVIVVVLWKAAQLWGPEARLWALSWTQKHLICNFSREACCVNHRKLRCQPTSCNHSCHPVLHAVFWRQ